MLSFAYKWQGDKRVTTKALPDYQNFKKDKEDDSALIADAWKLLDEADIVVAHNGDRFDLKKCNARFIHRGLNPPSPYKTIDTLKLAKRHFAFSSNRLNDLGAYLGLGRKLPHTGFHLWKGCMSGDKTSWPLMRRYNARDVELLEKLYLRLRPWATSHPNLNSYHDREACPTCESVDVQHRGIAVTTKLRYERLCCRACGHWFKGKKVA